jgi:MFS family permease
MSNYTSKQTLTREQKEAVFLLSIGTLLEYFDLMLYVHMSVLLNELFFPQGNPATAEIFAIFTFCSTFVLRPIGGLLIGWVGDHVGRKNTIILTTFVMALCCITMATVPTYKEIGLTASVIVIICRILQGFSSMGEVVGAQLYLSETLKQPYKYMFNNIINIQAVLGGLLALAVAYMSTVYAFNWRIAFWAGIIIALVGLVARTRLRETPEFVDYKLRFKKKQQELTGKNNSTVLFKEKVDKKTVLAYFFIRFLGGVSFYTTFIYTASFMKSRMGMTAEQVIGQNLKVTFFVLIVLFVITYLLKIIHPLRLTKINLIISAFLLLFVPYGLNNISASDLLLLTIIQLALYSFQFTDDSAEITCFKHVSLSNRFTILAVIFGLSAAVSHGVIPFILIFLAKYVGHYAIWVIYAPILTLYWCSLNYIKKLEIKKGLYYNYPDVDNMEDSTKYPPKKYLLGKEYKDYNLNCEYSQTLLNIVLNKARETNKQINIKLIEKAIIFAKKWHDGQFRKTGEPYYSHPLAVAGMVMGYKFSTNIIVAAILHDVVEDSACTVELIGEEFNPRIAEIVERLTRIKHDENHNETKLSIEEIMSDLIKADDTEAMLVKAIDRLHNLKTVHGMQVNKQRKTVIETLKSIIQHIAYTVDNLNIGNKLKLEEEMYQHCKNILKISK